MTNGGRKQATLVDPRAAVSPGAQLDSGVEVGPFAVIGDQVRIGAGTRIGPHVVLDGRTTIGENNRIFQFASVGAPPQDLKYRGEESELIIGDDNVIRECVTIHKGTEGDNMVTRIGSGNLIMAYCHVAHDCVIGDRVILANGATIAGHVTMEDNSFLAGYAGVHQFCRVGTMAFVAAGSIVVMDVPPYTTAQGDRARLVGLNLEGLKRKQFTPGEISALKKAYRILFRSGLVMDEAIDKVRQEVENTDHVRHLLGFMDGSQRGFTR
ncbi:MAG: acyl-ACP--UDP-N-acetylglucosamine O-acyltransferase [bacterium]|nr:acyl-ACP--UDP-N-acetylglucosamine O-acyltransferase [bacterium]MDT8395623.1 acyl-ACP--UDP-N-acetylglucosamine O-acyltransferase [bacterium]